ncbi:hypothetical protein [Phaeocystidibacter luteus]|uniref:Porin family protein n=1 Tax=Phaeocystidibacter luteus TaxID=911197 RepID=A0A6N6RL58_9FLAO|nr:hypothetical protein [Phaeocystidibacter luteus]KAB2813702.1 hypothetical protein F8C67_05955 [Phaeocystidibacter luteus]
MKKLLSIVLFALLSTPGYSQTLSGKNFVASTYAGVAPKWTWSNLGFSGGIGFQYQHSALPGVSVAMQVGTYTRTITLISFVDPNYGFCRTGCEETIDFNVYSFYPRIDLHPISWFSREFPLDVYFGAGYGYFFHDYDSVDLSSWDYAMQGGIRYWINDSWGVYLESGIRDQSQVVIGGSFAF